MDVEITIKNYRCFSEASPARFVIGPGMGAFIGVNNAGKSSLLKFFYEFRALFQRMSIRSSNFERALRGTPDAVSHPSMVVDVDELFCNFATGDLEIEFRLEAPNSRTSRGELVRRMVIHVLRGTMRYTCDLYSPNDTNKLLETSNFSWAEPRGIALNEGRKLDLQTMIKAFEALSKTYYVPSFRNAINVGGSDSYYDIQVGQPFIQAWDRFKAGGNKQQAKAATDVQAKIRDIFGFRNLEINPSTDSTTLVLNIDDQPYNLSEVGSGVAQFILVLINAAIQSPAFILIDEPELNLHPSLQEKFLTTLGEYATEGVLFATHSVGLARAMADRIYSVRKSENGGSEVHLYDSTPGLSEFLGELNFSAYRDLGFDRVLLVEGATDMKVFRQLLGKYEKDHVMVLSLGGDDMINGKRESELLEVKRISGDVSAVIDSERTCSGGALASNRKAFEGVCKKIGIECHVLERRATENYWTDRAVKAVKAEKYQALNPFERLNEMALPWGKAANWRIAREMTREELDGTDLGEFLRNL